MSAGGWEDSYCWLAGQTLSHTNRFVTSQYLLLKALVDLFSMARLEWRHWDMFTETPIGTVAVSEKVLIQSK